MVVKVEILQGKKLELNYPCKWEYRLVGKNEEEIRNIAIKFACEKPYTLNKSNKSSSGKFVSIIFEVLIYSDDERIYFFEELKKQKEIMYVL